MRNLNRSKKGLILLLLMVSGLSFFSFRDNGKYTMINDRVIKRDDGVLYEKGKINLKFKNPINSITDKKFGISQLDNVISQFNISEVQQRFPLKPNVALRKVGDDDLAKFYAFSYQGDIDPFELAERIKQQNSDIIEWVEPVFVYEADYVPNDPLISSQYHIPKISSFQAWDIIKGDTNVIIGIVDSGSDLDHPDLQANIKRNWAENPTNGIDDDGNGYVDDWIGWDFIGSGTGQDNDPQIYGTNCDHGSHVSGDVSQVTDNGTHGAGIGFKCKLLISKHGNDNDFSGQGGTSLIYNSDNGIIYCYQNGAKVINCSYGSGTFSNSTQNIVTNAWNAGTIVVASAGNDGQNIPRYPASYANVVSVAASNSADLKASFSNWHSTVDVIAPGEGIISTVWNNSYANFSGTSMSSPITAGTVALIRSKYPSWTPTQVVDRLKAAVDSIYNIGSNSNYIGGLGTGRINAFKSVIDSPLFNITSSSYTDSVYGNNDKVFDVGEVIPIAFTAKNVWLPGSNVSLRLTTSDPDVEIVKDSVFIGNVVPYTSYSTQFNNTFQVKAKPSCPFDKTVTFRIVSSSSAYVDDNSNTISILFRQGYAVHNINNLKLALTRDGAIGKKTQPYGSGLFLDNGNVNSIYEGSLMIGINNTQVSDVARRGPSPANISDTDFVALSSYNLTTPGLSSNQDGRGLFNDDGAGPTKIGVQVKAQSFAFNTPADNNYILLRYNIRNTTGATLNNMHVGIYMFFSPTGAFTANVIGVDTTTRVGYTYNNTTNDPYLGVALLTGQNLNFKALQGSDIFTGFTPQKKWDALSSGVSVSSLTSGPNAMVISAGPITLNSNDTTTIAFAVVRGSNLVTLLANTLAAKTKYFATNGVNQISENIPDRFELSQNYPNPFNPATTVKFAIPQNGLVKIKVYDMLGKEVADLVNEQLKAGVYEVNFNAAELSSGMYFYRIETPGFVETKKMMLIK